MTMAPPNNSKAVDGDRYSARYPAITLPIGTNPRSSRYRLTIRPWYAGSVWVSKSEFVNTRCAESNNPSATTRPIASSNVVPDVAEIDRKTLEAWVQEFRLDGVIVTRVVNVERETEYIPPNYTKGGYYGAWVVPISPGRVVEKTTISLETDLFDAKTEKLVYSAVTKTFDPSSRAKAIHQVIDALAGDMTKRGLLPESP